MDHPSNPRFPSPTYTIHESEAFGFLQYAFLFDEPYVLEPGAPLSLRYRVVVFDGEAVADHLGGWFDQFGQSGS